MFSNIEVENIPMKIQESHDNNRIENVNADINMTVRPQNNGIPQSSTNQSNSSNCIGNGVITVIKYYYISIFFLPINLCLLYLIDIIDIILVLLKTFLSMMIFLMAMMMNYYI